MLSKRLIFIASFVDQDSSIADIGSDHGLLPLYLVDKKIIKYGYACDNKKGPYLNLVKTLKNTLIKTSLQDGLNNLPPEVNTVILAGMGGLLINKILEKGKKYFKQIDTFIISPHSDIDKVRIFMEENEFTIVDEGIVYDDKYYHVLKYKKGKQNLTIKERLFGPILLTKKEKIFLDFINKEKDEKLLLLNKPLNAARINEIKSYLSLIEEIL